MKISSDFDFAVVDFSNDLLWTLLVDGGAEGQAGAEDLLDGTSEVLGHGLLLDDLGDLLDLLEGEVALVVHVLHFLSVALVVAEFLDQQGGGAGVDGDLGGSVLALQLHHHADALPLGAFLHDVLTDFLGVLRGGRRTRPRGPSLGARVAAGPASPPNTLMLTEWERSY